MSPTIVACGSGIEHVTVYARGAVITRRIALPDALPEGVIELRIPGISALADAGSVRAICDGEREVTALSARLALPASDAKPGSLATRIRDLDLDRARIAAERASLADLRGALASTRLDPGLSRWAKRLDPAARFADAAALHGLVGAEIARIDAAIRDLDAALVDLRRAREAASLEASQAAPDAIQGEDRARLEVRLRFAPGGEIGALAIEYVVGAARWWPAYSARFTEAATKVGLTLDAFVAQATGEDWSRVRLSLSTAHLAHDARLPDLASLRLSRAQPPPKRGYRAAPEGLASLFEGYDRAFSQVDARPLDVGIVKDDRAEPAPEPQMVYALDALESDEEMTMTRSAGYGAPSAPSAAPMPMPMSIPMPQAAMAMPVAKKAEMAAPEMAKRREMPMPLRARLGRVSAALDDLDDGDLAASSGGGGASPSLMPPTAIEPSDAWLDFDVLVLVDPIVVSTRGRLVRDPGLDAGTRIARARARIDAIAEPPLTRDPLASRGRFDHRYDAAATADVPATGRPHRVSVGAESTSATPHFVTVPREAAEVYREAEIKNPFDAPLLAGPVDVFLDGALMTTSEMAYVDRNGSMRIGLGAEDRLRVARNARVDESTAGLLGGSLVVDHAVTVDISSSLGGKVKVDVIERVPISGEKDVEVKLTYSRPDHERYNQAERGAPVQRGMRFSIEVGAGEKAKIEFGYRVTLPAKNEIVGGNRRE